MAEPRFAHERVLRQVDARLRATGEGIRYSEASLPSGSISLIGWQAFMTVVVPLGTFVVLAATALRFAFVSAQDHSLLGIFITLGAVLLVAYVLVFVWFAWAQGTLRAGEYLEQVRLTERQRARVLRHRAHTDPFLFPRSDDD